MEYMAAQMDSQIEGAISENERLMRENEELRGALSDLLSWFPEKPSPPEWRFMAGEQGADDAVAAARAAIATDICRIDGRCQYAIDHGAEGLGHCPTGKCVMSNA